MINKNKFRRKNRKVSKITITSTTIFPPISVVVVVVVVVIHSFIHNSSFFLFEAQTPHAHFCFYHYYQHRYSIFWNRSLQCRSIVIIYHQPIRFDWIRGQISDVRSIIAFYWNLFAFQDKLIAFFYSISPFMFW